VVEFIKSEKQISGLKVKKTEIYFAPKLIWKKLVGVV